MVHLVKTGRAAGATRRGSGELPVIAAVGLFAAVLGFLFYTYSRQELAPPQADAAQLQREADAALALAQNAGPPLERVTAEERAEVAVPQQNSSASEAAPVLSRLKLAEAHLAAGEFGPALDLARATTDVNEQTQILRLVADAQIAAGEFNGARRTIRRIPVPRERGEASAERAVESSLAGGGTIADFTQLIELIQDNTSGEWEDIDGVGGTMSPYNTGVRVDPNGVLARATREEQQGRLQSLGLQARVADLNEDMAQPSQLRLVSLTRLEQEVARRVANGEPALETMRHLAGLTQVRYVFVYPEDGEIVLGGPAEGWRYNEQGIPVGVGSGKPTLQLDDLVTVIRTFSPEGLNYFGCLIVPRQEGLKEVKDFVEASNARGPLHPGAGVRNWVKLLQEKLGLHDAVFDGVPADSRVARVILEADYRMKLIGIGELEGGPGIPSYFDLLTPTAIKQNPPQLDAMRWWMTMKYDSVLHSPDRSVFQIQGSSVRCLSENELIDDQGRRIHTGSADPTNQLFAQNFTNHFAELAERDLVFADMQNIFDLALVAALLRHENLPQRAEWNYGTFGPRGDYQPARYEVPKTVMTVANHRVYNGKDVIVQVAGGVRGDLASVLQDGNVYRQADRLANMADQGEVPNLPEGRWWWDAQK